MNEKISVIVPVYNVERYIDRCIKSIVNQTYKDLEIIIIDDGSTDKSGWICDKWEKKDERIKVIHKENCGLSDARNVGIDNSTGEYISFVDSDDMLVEDIYEIMLRNIRDKDLDIAIFNYCKINENDGIVEKNDVNESILEDDNKYELLYFSDKYTYAVVAWNKIYNKSIFNNLRFPVGRVNEDDFIIHEILYRAKKIGTYDNIGYKYRCRSNSITNVYNRKRLDVIEALENRLKYIKLKNMSRVFYEQTLYYYKYNLIQHSIMIKKYYYGDDKNTILKKLREKYKNENTRIKNTQIKAIHRIKFKIYEIFPKLGLNLLCMISKC